MEQQTEGATRKRGFLYKFRWTLYSLFIAVLVFIAGCMLVGILSNLQWRYADLDIPIERPEALEEIRELRLRDCLSALETLHRELRQNVNQTLEGAENRSELLRRWRQWNREWRMNFERVGFSCRLGEIRYDKHPSLGVLAGIYRILDSQQLVLDRMVRAFVLENARSLMELHQLFERARRDIESAGEKTQ